jgi:hypothetical protein
LTENGAMKRHFSIAAAPPRNGGSKDEIGQQKFAAMAGPDAELSSDATDDAHLDAQVGVDSAAERAAPRDLVGDWLLSLARSSSTK